jgi:hypothetical protein
MLFEELTMKPEMIVVATSPSPIVTSTNRLRQICSRSLGRSCMGISHTELNAVCTVRTAPRPLHSAVSRPTTNGHQEPVSPLIDFGSSSGNMLATFVRTESLELSGSTQPSTVTRTSNKGKIEKKAQKAIIAARLLL